MIDNLSEMATSVAADFPVLDRLIDGRRITYLDSAATALTPRTVIDAMVKYYAETSANIHRGKHRLSDDASTAYEDARARTAEFFGAATTEVVFVRNTTEALNIVAGGLDLAPSDDVLIGFDAHHSNMLPWRSRAKASYIPVLPSGEPDLDRYASMLKSRPRVVALTHASNVTGVVWPLAEMAQMAKAEGAIVVADLAQSAAHRRIRLRELDVDFAAVSGHKLLGPTGIGVLYGKAAMLERIAPRDSGGGTVDWVDHDRFVFRDLPHRLEGGTPHIAGAYGLHAAFDYLDELGMDRVEEHGAQLSALMDARIGEREYLTPICSGRAPNKTSIASFTIDGVDNLDRTARALSDSYGVMCRSGHMCAQPLVADRAGAQVLRASAHVYNSAADVELLFSSLDELCARAS